MKITSPWKKTTIGAKHHAQVHERYITLMSIVQCMAHRVTFFPGNVTTEVEEGETVLDAAVAAGFTSTHRAEEQAPAAMPRPGGGPPSPGRDGGGRPHPCMSGHPEGELYVFVPAGREVRRGRSMPYTPMPRSRCGPWRRTSWSRWRGRHWTTTLQTWRG